jgi:hypothetical protein
LKLSFEAWDKLNPQQCSELLARIQALDAAPDIDQTTAFLGGHAVLAVGHDKANAFLQRLDGWFLQRVTAMLRDPAAGPVTCPYPPAICLIDPHVRVSGVPGRG